MTWEKTHRKGECPQPLFAAIFMRAGAIWKCDDCGTRWIITKTPVASDGGGTKTGFRRLP